MAEMLQLWNMALGFVGTRTVASTDEDTPEAAQCALFWDSARRQVLRDYPWNFARRRQWLARAAVPAGWEGEYAAAFALPHDCLKVLEVQAGSGGRRLSYALVHDNTRNGLWLLANAAQALVTYTADITHIAFFDDLCAHLLARRLAALIAAPLLRDNTAKINELEQLYRAALPAAREANAAEAPRRLEHDPWLAGRCDAGGAR